MFTRCDYTDDTLLNNTEFNENNYIYVAFNIQRECTCGKLEERKMIYNILQKKIEIELKEKIRGAEKNF